MLIIKVYIFLELVLSGKLRRFLQVLSDEIVYVFGFLYFYLRFMLHYEVLRDDVEFSFKAMEADFFQFLDVRYETWSSRIFIEAFVWCYYRFVKDFDFVVFGLFSLCFVSVFYGLCYLLKPKTLFQKNVILLFVAGIPNMYFNNCGWGAVMLNYVFPLGFGLFALSAVRDAADCKSISWFKGVCYVAATLIAGNLEQYAFVLGAVLSLALLWFYICERRIVSILVMELLGVVVNVILFLTSQGNGLRYVHEIWQHRPNLPELSFMDRFFSGAGHFLDIFFFDGYILGLLFLLISFLSFTGWRLQQRKVFWNLWGVMAIVTIMMVYYMMHYEVVYPNRYNSVGIWYVLPILLIWGVCYLVALFYRCRAKFWVVFMLFGAGVASVVILGFAPSLYASNMRVFMGLMFILLYLLLNLFIRYADEVPYCNWIMLMFGVYWTIRAMIVNFVL